MKHPDDLVNKIFKKIAEAVRPDQIILFGSRAHGNARKGSDVDLLLIYSGPKSKWDRPFVRHEQEKMASRPPGSLQKRWPMRHWLGNDQQKKGDRFR